jgi:histidinol-phosphate aminotransferase
MRSWQYYPRQDRLRVALASYLGSEPSGIVLSNGADESIDLLLRTILDPGQTVIDCPPSFEMYRIYARVNRGRVIEVDRGENFTLDAVEVGRVAERVHPKVIIVASPNNPDGGILPREDLKRLLATRALVVLDEAYAEFAGESAVSLIPQYGNLVILRTFSKWAGLAGLRVGYAVLDPALAAEIGKFRSPYNVNAAGVIAASASLDDVGHLMARVSAIVRERERMMTALARLGFLRPLPSRANFLLSRVVGLDAYKVKDYLSRRGILIRAFTTPRLREYIRISIGTSEQNDMVLAALGELVS